MSDLPEGTFLDNDDVLVVSRTLAKAVGLNESIVIRQIHYWLRQFAKTKSEKHFRDGRWWVYNTYLEWQSDNFDFWSWNTIQRIIADMEGIGIVLSSSEYNARKGDQTKWYSIDYIAYEAFLRLWSDYGYPVAGSGRMSEDYKLFVDEWNSQRMNPEIIQLRADQFSNMLKAVTQHAKAVTRDYNREKEKDYTAPNGTVQTDEQSTSVIDRPKKERATKRNPFMDAVAKHIFGLEPETVKGKSWVFIGTVASRIKSVDETAEPHEIEQFAAWCKTQGFSAPRGDRLEPRWQEFINESTRAVAPVHKIVTELPAHLRPKPVLLTEDER